MSAAVLFVFYGSIAFCLIASSIRLTHYSEAPIHLKWELYDKSSIYEFSDWQSRQPIGFWAKFKSMLIEVLFLRQYYRKDRTFWYALYPFHVGLYLLILWHIWMFVMPLVSTLKIAPQINLIWGHVSTSLALAGSSGILIKRIIDNKLKLYYPPLHYLKWGFVLITLGIGLYTVCFYFDNRMSDVLAYIKEQLTFTWAKKLNPPLLPALHVLSVSVWLLYLPFSHIMQLFLKYYHEIRWDQVLNLKGSDMEHRVSQILNKTLTWAAPHIQVETWNQIAHKLFK